MAKWQESFDKIRSGVSKHNTSQEDTKSSNKVKQNVNKIKNNIDKAKKTANFIGNILLNILNGIIFLISNPIGWIIDLVVLVFLLFVVMSQVVGQVDFNSNCPQDPTTGKIHTLSKEDSSKTGYFKSCKAYGTGHKKGRTSGGDDSEGNSAGGSGEWAKNGTGKVNYHSHNAWRPEQLPADLKQYALNPKSVGLSYRSANGWNVIAWSGGQCTDLSASLMNALWEKNGQHPVQKVGNGSEVTQNWASKFGGSVSSKPTAGAVFSQTPSSAGGSAGHTGLVSHVFADGNILVIEQNYSNLSGENQGFGKYTWNYRYVTTAEISTGYTFYNPSQSGFKITSRASSM